MKKFIVLMVIGLSVSSICFAQTDKKQMGPKDPKEVCDARNYKDSKQDKINERICRSHDTSNINAGVERAVKEAKNGSQEKGSNSTSSSNKVSSSSSSSSSGKSSTGSSTSTSNNKTSNKVSSSSSSSGKSSTSSSTSTSSEKKNTACTTCTEKANALRNSRQ